CIDLRGAWVRIRRLGWQRPRWRRKPRVAPQRRLPRRLDFRRHWPHTGALAPVVDRGRDPDSARPLPGSFLMNATEQTLVSRPSVHTRVREGMRSTENWIQLFKFACVGGTGTVLNLAVFTLFAVALDVHHLVAAT